jgi:hypothetical protein
MRVGVAQMLQHVESVHEKGRVETGSLANVFRANGEMAEWLKAAVC